MIAPRILPLLAFWGLSSGQRISEGRKLSLEEIVGYTPSTTVTDHNAIDLDVSNIIGLLEEGTPDGFEAALRIYNEGAHSGSIAKLTLTEPLGAVLSVDDLVLGFTEDGLVEVRARSVANYPKDTTQILVRYEVTSEQASYSKCVVGANLNPILDGCFGSSGPLVVDGFDEPLSYSYDQITDNTIERSIAKFSREAEISLGLCAKHCPKADYEKFRDYYGDGDYADQWVQAASTAGKTTFLNGDADFSDLDLEGRYVSIVKATQTMALWMWVLRSMETALDGCEDPETQLWSIHYWDQAVAYYSGSLEGPSGQGEGVLSFDLADIRCLDFKTCGPNGDSTVGTSYVNLQIIPHFQQGGRDLKNGDCDGARSRKQRIIELMTVPLIQATLRYAYLRSLVPTVGRYIGESATLAASVLPIIHACEGNGPQDAEIIYNNLNTGSTMVDFGQVKAAFERNYGCLNIVCEEVGGYWDPAENNYRDGAQPCGVKVNMKAFLDEDQKRTGTIIAGILFGSLLSILFIVCLSSRCGKKPAPMPVFSENKTGEIA